MRITFVLPCSGRYPIGGFRIVYEYANRLADRGHQVAIVHFAAFPDLMPMKRLIRAAGQWVRDRITGGYLPKSWFKLSPNVITFWGYAPSIGIFPDADVVIATAWQTAEVVNGLPHAKGRKLYLLQSFEVWGGPAERVTATWKMPMRKLVIAKWLQDIADRLGEDSTYLPNALDTSFFSTIRDPAERLPQSLLFCSHPLPLKGTRDIVAAVNALRSEGLPVEVTTFGRKHPSEFALEGSFHHHEDPPQSTLQALYNDSAIFIAASHEGEGWGLTPAEAAACGAALIVSDNGGHRDFLTDGETAMMFPPGDVQALKTAIRSLLEDPESRIALARRAHAHIQRYDWTKSVDTLESVLIAETGRA